MEKRAKLDEKKIKSEICGKFGNFEHVALFSNFGQKISGLSGFWATFWAILAQKKASKMFFFSPNLGCKNVSPLLSH